MNPFRKLSKIETFHGISVRIPEVMAVKPLELIEKILTMDGDVSIRCTAIQAIAEIYKMPNVTISNCNVELK